MLVDLARNDIARVCQSGTRKVAELMQVDRYSHIMHLVSRVVGKLRPELDALHAYQACMNMGTLTGAPKIKAMQLIYQFEQQNVTATAVRSVISRLMAILIPVS